MLMLPMAGSILQQLKVHTSLPRRIVLQTQLFMRLVQLAVPAGESPTMELLQRTLDGLEAW